MFLIASLLFAAPAAAASAKPANVVSIAISGLRNARGTVRVCMTRQRAHFPGCQKDPAALAGSSPATAPTVEITGVAPGDYAIAVFQDENDNLKLDTMMGIPREGFGFSRNPKIRFGPPKFDEVRVTVPPGGLRTSVKLKYLL